MRLTAAFAIFLVVVTAKPLKPTIDTVHTGSASDVVTSGTYRIVPLTGPSLPQWAAPDSPGHSNKALSRFDAHCSGRSMPDDYYHDIGRAIKKMTADCKQDNTTVKAGHAKYWRSGNAQIYICNYSQYDEHCSKEIYDKAMADVDMMCGSGGGGWKESLGGRLTWDARYSVGRDPVNDEKGAYVHECGW